MLEILDFNPRSPWGERLDNSDEILRALGISIHAPRGGSDPRLALRVSAVMISIHAPRGGSDLVGRHRPGIVIGISIHAPRGGSDKGVWVVPMGR